MIELVRSGQAVAFVGAGVSRGLGYPTWNMLIQQLADATLQHCGENIVDDRAMPLTVTQVMQLDHPLFKAEIFKENLQGHYLEIIRQTFAPRGSNSDTRALVSIPFQHLLTSNYDFALENAHSDIGKRFETMTLYGDTVGNFVNGIADFSYPRQIVHVHGRYDEPENIVLTFNEYTAFYHRVPMATTFWNMVPIARKCIFFGFSFTDEELTEGFNLRNFNRAHRQAENVVHFAAIALSDPDKEPALRSRFAAEFGIEAVFFNGMDAKFTGFSNLIQRIAEEFAPKIEQPLSVQVLAPQPEVIGLEDEILPQADVVEAVDPVVAPEIAADVLQLEKLTDDNLRKRSTGDLQ
jgi:SIR2-like protein